MGELPQLTPGLSFLDHTVKGTRYIYSAYPMLTLVAVAPSGTFTDGTVIDPKLDHVIYADGVRISGKLAFEPGRKVTIVARTLDAVSGALSDPAAIDVSGKDAAAAALKEKADKGGTGANGSDAIGGGAFNNGTRATEGQPGGPGTDGADGKDGTDAGEIHLFVQALAPNAQLALIAKGGDGSKGQQGGDGGPGGDGGKGAHFTATVRHVEHYYLPPGEGGPGGDAGAGGRGGRGGNGGKIALHVPEGANTPARITLVQGAGASFPDAAPGTPGQGGMRPEFLTYATAYGPRAIPPKDARPAARRSGGNVRKRAASPALPPAQAGAPDTAALTPRMFAEVIHPTQCRMMLQRAKAEYMTATVATYAQAQRKKKEKNKPGEPKAAQPGWSTIFDWLDELLKIIDKDPALHADRPLDRPAFDDLRDLVKPLKSHADNDQDIYGKYADQVAVSMLTPAAFENLLKGRMEHLQAIARTYTTLSEKLKAKAAAADALEDALLRAGARRAAIAVHVDDLIRELGVLGKQIDAATVAVSASRQAVLDTSHDFTVDIARFHFDLPDFLSALTMVAFSPPGITEVTKTAAGVVQGGDLHGTPMSIIQAADFVTKATTQIKSDSGIAVSQAYLVKKVNLMAGRFSGAEFAKVYTSFKGTLQEPAKADTEKILVSIEEYERLVEDYLSMASAQKLDGALRSLTAAILQRNDMIFIYNASVERILQLQEEMEQLSTDRVEAMTKLAKGADPDLPRLVSYLSLQYANVLEDATQAIHEANKAYAYWSLDTRFNVFREVLAASAIPWGVRAAEQVTPQVLVDCSAALQRQFWQKIKTSPEPQYIPADLKSDSHQIFITDRRLLDLIRAGKEIQFQVDREARSRAGMLTIPLAEDLYDLRLLGMRVFLNGAALQDPSENAILKLEVTHGVEDTFYDDDIPVTFRHQTVKRFNFEYRPAKQRRIADKANPEFVVAQIEIGGPLTKEAVHRRDAVTYAGFGPFTTWTLKVSDKTPLLDRPLENIEVQFLFLYRKQ